jgi:class 3 adenylate cyclase/tetratricopeptide (TPR) repeat protein
MRCTRCGFENAADTRFCGECAAPLSRPCRSCGFDNPPQHKFCGQCAAPLTGSPSASPPSTANPSRPGLASGVSERLIERPAAPASSVPEGERKTVTPLFADIKGSMELMEDLDPEEARRLIDPALALMIDSVHHYDGYIVQSTGDGIFALFGAPIAHEDHPQRALHAALRIQEEMRRYCVRLREAGNLPIEARVGVNTGEVVVRSIRTGEAHAEYTAIGHSISLAARMQALAPTGSIAATDYTRKLCEGYFAFKPLGPTRVKGVSEPIDVFEVTGLGALRRRLQVSQRRGLSRFVGRQAEMDAMSQALELARAGHGQIVAAVGEAGVGKSRLFHEFKAIAHGGALILEAFSVSHGQASPYLPLIDLLRNYFHFSLDDDARKRREKVAGKVLMLDRALEETLPYLFGLLGIIEGEDRLAGMDAQIRQQRTHTAIRGILQRETLNQPLIVVFEDLHWIDSETQTFLNLLTDSIADARLLLLFNYRPEYRHDWGDKRNYTQLRLNPLGRDSADEMLSALLDEPPAARDHRQPRDQAGAEKGPAGASDRAALKQFIIDRTEGNPFFMEELVQSMFEEGVLVHDGSGVKLAKSTAALRVPPTVQGVLSARIDRLPPRHKDLLQTMAVIGKESPLGLIRKIAAAPEDELGAMLSGLQVGEFIYEQPAVPEAEYTFKHALTQDVAYNSVLGERRKALHQRTAEAIESVFAGQLDDHLNDLVHHCTRAGDIWKAADYLERAIEHAARRSAHREAAAYLFSGQSLLAGLPQSRERSKKELALILAAGLSMFFVSGAASPEMEMGLGIAKKLCDEVGEDIHQFWIGTGLMMFHRDRMQLRQAREVAEELVVIARRSGNPGLGPSSASALAQVLMYQGEFAAAETLLSESEAAALSLGALTAVPGISQAIDPRSWGLNILSFISWQIGYPERALRLCRQAVEMARESPRSVYADALLGAGHLHCQLRDARATLDFSEALVALATEQGFSYHLAYAHLRHGWAVCALGRHDEGLDEMHRALDALQATGTVVTYADHLTLAESYAQAGRPEEGLKLLADAPAEIERTGFHMIEAELYRVTGELMLACDAAAVAQAEGNFRRAIDVARAQNAKSWELRAATSLARLLAGRGRRDQARALLNETYGWFSEGFDTRDLREAHALLEELAR